ncbi:MAG: NifU family protein [Deltaproteobacteria bacterium]|nr:NifU family protein [Deltaproteobacteria bacterium]
MSENITVSLQFTPNPNTLKFVVNRTLMDKGAANFTEVGKAEHAPFAKKLFDIPGVSAVMVGRNFVTITKSTSGNWDVLSAQVPKTIESYLASGAPLFSPEFSLNAPGSGAEAEVEQKIREILDNEIRPAVAMDGGDIELQRYENGIAYLYLQGACSSCPSAIMTLKMGVEARLKEAVPELKEVVEV